MRSPSCRAEGRIRTTVAIAVGLPVAWASPVHASPPVWNQQVGAVEVLVRVGEHALNFRVIGGDGPTVLLESGGGWDSNEWNTLAPELARTTGATVVAYDRAGFGRSDLPATPHDMHEEVEWLWRGLQQLELDEDLILVGHSFGGWMVRLFASEHPGVVRGLVFVDAFTNEFVDLLGVEYLDNHPVIGRIPFDTSHADRLTPFQRAVVRMVGDGIGPKRESMRGTSLPPGVPVVVIVSGRRFLLTAEEHEAWRLAQERMAASIEGAMLVVAEESGHMIPAQQPALIIEAVATIIRLSAAGSR